jgi:hypothetical protein
MKNWRNAFSILGLVVGLFACLQSFAPAKIERSKVIKKDFAGKAEVSVLHQYGPLVVKKSADNRVHLTAEMLLTGSDEAAMEEVLDRFDIDVEESGSLLRLKTSLGIESCNTINDRMTIKYNDGKKVKGVNNFKVNLTLEVPNPEKMTLENKYDRIELLDDYPGALNVKLYSGDFLAANLGNFELDLKYGKARMNELDAAKLVLYDSELHTGNVRAGVDVVSKYSKCEIGMVGGDLRMETYDERWKVGHVMGKLMLNDKYSDFQFGNLFNAQIQVFDGNFLALQVGNLEIHDTKYAAYKFNAVDKLTIGNSFDDEYTMDKAGSISARDSKYTEYRVGNLLGSLKLEQSFDDLVLLNGVGAGFKAILVNGKYTKLTADIAPEASFVVTVDMKYGKFNYPENRLNLTQQLEKDNNIKLVGTVGSGDAGTNSFTVTGFDNTITWR